MQTYYEASGLKTHVLGCTHWAETQSEAQGFRAKLDAMASWDEVTDFVSTPLPQPPEPYPTDGSIGLTGYKWICAHD